MIEPSLESSVRKTPIHDLSIGKCFVVYEERPNYAFDVFADLVKNQIHGLAFIPNDPEELKESHGLVKTPILKTIPGGGPSDISFRSLDDRDYMLYLIRSFTSKSGNSVILLGGLEMLASSNTLAAIMFVKKAEQIVRGSKSRLILSISGYMVEKEEIKELLENFVELAPKD